MKVKAVRHYLTLVRKDEDSAFGVQFPDVEGAFSAADTAEKIVPNAIEALRLYAEDAELPEPSSHAVILRRPGVREELAKDAFLVQVPLIETDTAVVRANVSFERGLLCAIDEAAAARGLTRAAFLASAARKEIEA